MKQFEIQMQEDIERIHQTMNTLLEIPQTGYKPVVEAMRYSAMNAGKRIRPILTLEFCRLFGGDVEEALPIACAVEMIHCYSLIHDDLPCMDDDDMRRGKPSCHKQFDEATALLAGDALLTYAFDTISSSALAIRAPQVALKAVRVLSGLAGVHGMIGGQVIDLAIEGGEKADETLLTQVHLLKTSALLKASCELGAICAQASDEQQKIASEYAENLGLAFQIIDDILDVIGDETLLGKPIGSDSQNEKVTIVSLCGLEKAKEKATDYTKLAQDALKKLPQSEFLIALTDSLLNRNK